MAAYQVTPEGLLRQFRPCEVPREEPQPLDQFCIARGHDIPASFLNIDTDRYTTAWLAFANDPWPKKVLDDYLRGGVVDGVNLDDRFYKLDLKTARDAPDSIGIAMTENNLQVEQVLEYAQPKSGDFHSVHGFHGRNHRLRALAAHVRTVTEKYNLPNGVLALVLPDPIGVVQEVNAQRVARYQAMQEWRVVPQRIFELFTSEALLGIGIEQRRRAADIATQDIKDRDKAIRERNQMHPAAKSVVANLDIEAETERLIRIRQADSDERLAERYDEQARSDFETRYKNTLAAWQSIIDQVAEPYVSQYHGPAFRLAAMHDYSVTSMESVEAQIRMNGTCLAGGVTDRYTRKHWLRELENYDSLYYRILTGNDKGALEQLVDDLLNGELTRTYHAFKTFITLKQVDDKVVFPIRQLVSHYLAAGASASHALGSQLSERSAALMKHLQREALLRLEGGHMTQVTISLRIGEYLTLLNEVLYEGAQRFIAQLDKQFRKPAERKVRAMLLSGHFTPALAASHATLIDIRVWTMESAEELQARLKNLAAGVGSGIDDVLRHITIDPTALTDSMQNVRRQISINAESALTLARGAMRNLHDAGKATGSGKFVGGLALTSLYFQVDALIKSYENLLKTVGDGHPEAVAAVMSASFGVIGAGVESAGAAIQIFRPDLTVKVAGAVAGASQTVTLGYRVMQYGGAIVALASAAEGVQFALAAGRTGRAGDRAASNVYTMASGLALTSALFGVGGSLGPAALALVPLGAAVVLALIAYGLSVWAKKLESDALELWARHSRWGIPEKHRRWTTPEDMNAAIGVLNAALLGVTADAAMRIKAEKTGGIPIGDAVPVGLFLDYKIVLPGYVAGSSRYEWTLQVYRPGQALGEVIASGRPGENNGPLPPPASWKNPGYRPETTMPAIRHLAESGALEILGSISFFGKLEVHALQLELSYWPDRSDEAGVARLIVKEDKIGGVLKGDFE